MPDNSKHSVIVALPHPDDPVHKMGPEQSHVTLAYLGDDPSQIDGEALNREVAQVASGVSGPLEDQVSGRAELGDDKANVLLLDGQHLGGIRNKLLDQPTVMGAHDAAKQFPNWTPHLTLGYPGDGEISSENLAKVSFDRLAVWHGDQQTEHPLGANMTAPAETDAPTAAAVRVPWYGVLTTEGNKSGDRRSFSKGGLRNRDLPLRLTWQKASDEGHRGSVVVGSINGIYRFVGEGDAPNEIRSFGFFLQSPEADELVGQAVEFGNLGVSVDLDDATFEVDKSDEGHPSANFTSARIASASVCTIPAFPEAMIFLGEPPEGFMGEVSPQAVENPMDAVAASVEIETLKRGPGWVTNPGPTKRIHDYWTVPGQPGYEKIAWGTGGDFNRCRAEVGEEIGESSPTKLRFINQICAQWHHDALGFWPSTHKKMLGATADGVSMSLVASGGSLTQVVPKREWFADPSLPCATPLTYIEVEPGVTRVVGHLAEWGTCHLDFPGVCVTPPALSDAGENFMLGRVVTDDGILATGCLTLGGGHADPNLGLRAALAHYDDVTTAVADVRVGADEFGIWFAGWLRPWVSPQQKYELLAASLSGDWRDKGGELRLIAAHAVNSPGFGILQTHVQDGLQVSLVAAGGLEPAPMLSAAHLQAATVEMAGLSPTELVVQGIEEYERRKDARARVTAAAERAKATPRDRIERLRNNSKEN